MKDPCIRQILKQTELYHFFKDDDTRVVEELPLPIGKARIDIAVLNGSFHGYEIKSASDTLSRLHNQINAYEKVFDYLSVVTEEKYLPKLLAQLPSWVGIISCEQDMDSYKIREASLNENIDGFHIAKLLWREEILEVLKENNITFRKRDRNWDLCKLIAFNLKARTISSIVRAKLKKRQLWKL
jgi:hypothetical protein